MIAGFPVRRVRGSGAELHVAMGGGGPPLLLLHGYPQTHMMWHRVAPVLARHFTVICPDLRGYGASECPPSDDDHRAYSKRAMAADLVAVMQELGFSRFAAAGHDRGGRVLHRLCLDHPDLVSSAAVLDIVPTRTVFEATDQALATGYYHWFFLIQSPPLPERMISADPEFWVTSKLSRWSGSGLAAFAPEAVDAYVAAFREAAVVHGSCEDYRAAATIDLDDDRADDSQRIRCPLLVLWGERGLMHRHFDVPATWQEKAAGPVSSELLPCGHFLPEEQPELTAAALLSFFLRHRTG
ncbi:MAG TPA: alpha/beta hydrolase [Geminicoccus sp.]|jgi:haloacetate dehalogenase|uniref:alpha/beta fold hydrolase n=1 Tax=Geminicoccus sp. TaxID=2024832 RepID=UPI002E36C627|nr:alpha/beta hydrolase [Geminicoccus sp.]HEX2526465.1 alpha/beta hydrolase [Geminicoccus sp.]